MYIMCMTYIMYIILWIIYRETGEAVPGHRDALTAAAHIYIYIYIYIYVYTRVCIIHIYIYSCLCINMIVT